MIKIKKIWDSIKEVNEWLEQYTYIDIKVKYIKSTGECIYFIVYNDYKE